MIALWEDLRSVARGLRRAPLFFAGTTLTLAIGVGANGAVFSLLYAVLIQPLPNSRAEEIVRVWPSSRGNSAAGARFGNSAFASEELMTFRESARDILTDLAALESWEGNLTARFDVGLADHAERLRGAFVTPNFFQTVGVKAKLGRVFDEADEVSGQALLVLSHGVWKRSFGGDPLIIGRTVSMAAGRPRATQTYTVLGVLPEEFRFTYPQETEAWVQKTWAAVRDHPRGTVAFTGAARLKPGVSFEVAQSRIASIQQLSGGPTPPGESQPIARLERLEDWMLAETRPSLLLLGGVAFLLLLLTCSTVAGALFVRATKRQRELAIRSSLGAHRLRLVRELLIEGTTIAIAGSLGGVGLAIFLFPALRAVAPLVMPRADTLGLSVSFLAFGIAVTALVVLFSSVAPALHGSRPDLHAILKTSGLGASADASTVRWRHALLGLQSAVATALLVLASLLLVSFWRLQHTPLGFDGERVLTVEMRLLDQKYRTPAALADFQSALTKRVSAIPGVREIGLTTAVPFRGTDFLSVLGRAGQRGAVEANARYVDPGYFSVLRIGVKHGRGFQDTDTSDRPKVTVISESLARAMFRDDNPLGRTIDYGYPIEVVGVVGDLRYQSRDKAPRAAMYMPLSQSPNSLLCVLVRTTQDAGDVAGAIRRAVHGIDPAVPVMNAATVDQIISESVADRRFYTVATSAFASVALLLTTVGLGVVVSRTVAERQRELAIRAALGATLGRLVRLCVRQGVAPVALGAILGLCGAYFAGSLAQHLLFEVSPQGPWAYVAAFSVVVAVGVVACLVGARGVTEADPSRVLRAE
jgi:putative ABC transport system permease protein